MCVLHIHVALYIALSYRAVSVKLKAPQTLQVCVGAVCLFSFAISRKVYRLSKQMNKKSRQTSLAIFAYINVENASS